MKWLLFIKLKIHHISFIWLNSISGSLSEEICQKEVKPVTIETRIHKNSIPKGGVSAGRYTKDKDSTNQWLCIVSCCQDPNNCDSAFFHKNVCYLIKCNVTYSGACDPVTKTDAKYNDTVYVNVRDVGRLYMKQVPVYDFCGMTLEMKQLSWFIFLNQW